MVDRVHCAEPDGNADVIGCGPGHDKVIFWRARDRRGVLKNCEVVIIER